MNLDWQVILTIIVIPITFSYIFSILLKQSPSELIPVYYGLLTVWIYSFSIFDKIKIGELLFKPLLLLIAFFITIKIRKNFLQTKDLKQIISPSIIFFVIGSLWMLNHSKSMRFYQWDEFSYWGAAAKTIFFYEQIPALSINQGAFPEYIPGIPIFGSFASSAAGVWSDSSVFWTFQVFIISVIASLLARFTWKNIGGFLFALAVTLLTSVYFYDSFQSVYADPIMSILFGYCLYLASTKKIIENKTYLLNLSILLTWLAITKDIAIFLVFVTLVTLLINLVINEINFSVEISKFNQLLKVFSKLSLVTIPVLFVKSLWKYLIQSKDLPQGREFFNVLLNFLTGKFNDINFWPELKQNFTTKVTDSPITFVNGLPISTLSLLIMFTFLLFLTSSKLNTPKEKVHHYVTSLSLSFNGIIYLVVLLFAYTTFVSSEAIGLASFDRYVGSYFAGLIVFLSGKFTEVIAEKKVFSSSNQSIIYFVIFLLLQSSPSRLFNYITNPNYSSDQIRANYSGQSWLISEMAFKKGDRVWVITQHKVGFEFYLLQYELIPASVGKIPFSIGSAFGPEDIWTDISYTPEKWSEALQKFDYVFIDSISESFKQEFSSLFEDPTSLEQLPGIYEINPLSKKMLNRVR